MSSNSAGHNKYTVWVVLILSFIALVFYFTSDEIKIGDYYIKRGKNQTQELDSSLYNVSGDWTMTFDYKNCDNPEFALGKLECYYDVIFTQDGAKVKGNGWKHSEKFKGKFSKYPNPFAVEMEGEIKGSILSLKSFEKNRNNELTGNIKINLEAKRFILEGIFDPDGGNCNGIIKLERQ